MTTKEAQYLVGLLIDRTRLMAETNGSDPSYNPVCTQVRALKELLVSLVADPEEDENDAPF